MPVAAALDQSGAGKMIANSVIGVIGDNPSPYFAIAVLFILSCVMTQFMSNTASSALLAPIGISIACCMGADPSCNIDGYWHCCILLHSVHL